MKKKQLKKKVLDQNDKAGLGEGHTYLFWCEPHKYQVICCVRHWEKDSSLFGTFFTFTFSNLNDHFVDDENLQLSMLSLQICSSCGYLLNFIAQVRTNVSLGNYEKWAHDKYFKCRCLCFKCVTSDSLDHVHDLLAVIEPDVVVWDGHSLESDLIHKISQSLRSLRSLLLIIKVTICFAIVIITVIIKSSQSFFID